MNITVIAARLHQVADDIEASAAKNGHHEFPDEMVPRLVVNLFTDDKAMKVLDRERAARMMDTDNLEARILRIESSDALFEFSSLPECPRYIVI
jgi:hypothetical protein